jgi:hypothetical protein
MNNNDISVNYLYSHFINMNKYPQYLYYIDTERELCPWAISKYFGDLVSNTSA